MLCLCRCWISHVVLGVFHDDLHAPSDGEITDYYNGLPPQPCLMARSSCDIQQRVIGTEADLDAKELTSLGAHPFNDKRRISLTLPWIVVCRRM